MVTWNIKVLANQQDMDPDVSEFLPLFSSELSKAAAIFQVASLTENSSEAARLCHRMRGSASLYGFKCFAERLLSAEALIKAGELLPSAITVALSAVAAEVAVYVRTSPQLLTHKP